MIAMFFSLGLRTGRGVGVGAGGGALNHDAGGPADFGEGDGDSAPVRRTAETITASRDNQRTRDFIKESFLGFGYRGLGAWGECLVPSRPDKSFRAAERPTPYYGAAEADAMSGN